MNTTELVVEIRPEENSGTGLKFVQVLFQPLVQ